MLTKRLFGEDNGKKIYEFTIKNAKGIELYCLNYGCAVTRIITPDRNGLFENIVLGFEDLDSYKHNDIYAGVIVGRVGGRIKNACFNLEGKTYTLAKNNGENHLHGGLKGFQNAVWDAEIIEEENTIKFSYTSPDGEDGYPGTLTMLVTYTLNDNNEFVIQYSGQSDHTTLLNPTNHTYFNLSGNLKRDITEHSLKIDSSRFLELTDDLLPTGTILAVDNTVFDFRTGRKIIDGIHSDAAQNILAGHGYDHPYVLNSNNNREIILYDENSGRSVIIETNAIGVILYTGNMIPNNLDFRGVKSMPYLGLCLETQGLPDSIHNQGFPDCIIEKDQAFSRVTKYTFGVNIK